MDPQIELWLRVNFHFAWKWTGMLHHLLAMSDPEDGGTMSSKTLANICSQHDITF
jgi:hypothetical protein